MNEIKGCQGRVAIVTGSGRGIGFGIAQALSDAGAGVVLVDRDASILASARERIGSNREVKTIVADVSSSADMERVASETITAFGDIDIVCPNAAVFGSATIEQLDETAWDQLMSVNLKGVYLTVKACLPTMKSKRYGRIVATSSITGNRTAIVGMAHYASTKAGINGFVRAAALELAPFGITVNSVEPGHVMTEGTAPTYDPAFKAAVEELIPLGRLATPRDVAVAVVFLAGVEAGYITGHTLTIDGGLTLREYPPQYPKKA
jgi:3-oxoacyl-[acyl-carrier protein] reductase